MKLIKKITMTLLLGLKSWVMINEFAQAYFLLILTAVPGRMAKGKAIFAFTISCWEIFQDLGAELISLGFLLLASP